MKKWAKRRRGTAALQSAGIFDEYGGGGAGISAEYGRGGPSPSKALFAVLGRRGENVRSLEVRVAYWLLKTEPDCYSWADLERDKRTVWDGVSNALALKNIRAMKKGDLALFYHTGVQRAAVGVVEVLSDPYADPKREDERLAVVKVGLKKKLPRAVALAEFKADPAFAGWDLLRLGRLSVVPVPAALWRGVEAISKASILGKG